MPPAKRFACSFDDKIAGEIQWSLDLAPGGSRALIVGLFVTTGLKPRPRHVTVGRYPLDESFRFELTEPNVCVLDMPELQIG